MTLEIDDSTFIRFEKDIDSKIENFSSKSTSEYGTGGMKTKMRGGMKTKMRGGMETKMMGGMGTKMKPAMKGGNSTKRKTKKKSVKKKGRR